MVFIFLKFNNLKVIHDLYSHCLTKILSKTTLSFSMKGVLIKLLFRVFPAVVFFSTVSE